MTGGTLTADDLRALRRSLAPGPDPFNRIMVVPPWGPLVREHSGRRWWQFWRPRWTWRREEPDHVLRMGAGIILCTARQREALERELEARA